MALLLQARGLALVPPWAALLVLGVWGAAWSLPFYIPPGVMALSLGGAQHAALLTNVYDGASFFAAAMFSYFVMKAGGEGRWDAVLLPMVLGACAAAVCMAIAMEMDCGKVADDAARVA